MEKEIVLLDFKKEEKDLYAETMKLINKEIDEKQFIIDHLYNSMVAAIYINSFQKLEELKVKDPMNLLNTYLDSATDTYRKLRDLNKYVEYDFKPFDDDLVFYISTQYMNYFNQKDIELKETVTSFAEKIAGRIKEEKHHPFIRIKSTKYHVEELKGMNVYLNDLIYKSLKKNEDIIKNINISREDLIDIRRGRIKITKDILYQIFLGLQLSKYEMEQFIEKRIKNKSSFNTKRDVAIRKIINDINAYKNIDNENKNLLEITNELLKEKGLRPINPIISRDRKEEDSKSILLIGGLGFIGRECIEFFKKNQYKTYVLVKHIPTSIPQNVICYQGDITNKLVYERILSENKIDYIINLAAISTVRKGGEAFEETMLINEQAPNALYSSILENKFLIKGVIFPSTTLVYQGLEKGAEAKEDSYIIPDKITNDYAFSKYQAEQNSLRYIKKGVPIIITRLSNVYGEEDNNQRLIPEAIKELERGEEACLYVDKKDSNKSASINLVYIKDLLIAFKKIIEAIENKKISLQEKIIVNIANKEEYTVKEVLEKIYQFYQREFHPEIKTTIVPPSLKINTEKAEELFHFESHYNLESGLKEIIENREKKKEFRRIK